MKNLNINKILELIGFLIGASLQIIGLVSNNFNLIIVSGILLLVNELTVINKSIKKINMR